MSLFGRKVAAFGIGAVVVAGLAWLWMLMNEKHIERSVTKRHEDDRWGM